MIRHQQPSPRRRKKAALDSGATAHMFGSVKGFDRKSLQRKGGTVTVANGQELKIVGTGNIGPLRNACLVPGLDQDMVSIGQLCDEGKSVLFTKDAAYITNQQIPRGSIRIAQRIDDGLYDVREEILSNEQAYIGDTKPENLLVTTMA